MCVECIAVCSEGGVSCVCVWSVLLYVVRVVYAVCVCGVYCCM